MKEMSHIVDLSQLPNGYSCDSSDYIDHGDDAVTYNIDSFVGKIRHDGLFLRLQKTVYRANQLIDEYNIAVDLYNNGVSTPKPHGVFRVAMEDFYHPENPPIVYPAFLMEDLTSYRKADRLKDISLVKRVEALKDIEVQKIKSLGWEPHDTSNLANWLYSVEDDDLKAIDFARYERG